MYNSDMSTYYTIPIQAETGEGTDVFRVIVTIFGVDKSKGDMVAAVTVNDGEASRVKLLDSEAPYVTKTINGTGTSGGLIEYCCNFSKCNCKCW
jgi:hypothetical protein